MEKAHNPLVDSLFTIVVVIYIYMFLKPTDLKVVDYLT